MLRYTLLRLLRLCFHHRITLNQLAQAARAWQRPQNALPGVENADATARAWLTQAVPLPPLFVSASRTCTHTPCSSGAGVAAPHSTPRVWSMSHSVWREPFGRRGACVARSCAQRERRSQFLALSFAWHTFGGLPGFLLSAPTPPLGVVVLSLKRRRCGAAQSRHKRRRRHCQRTKKFRSTSGRTSRGSSCSRRPHQPATPRRGSIGFS